MECDAYITVLVIVQCLCQKQEHAQSNAHIGRRIRIQAVCCCWRCERQCLLFFFRNRKVKYDLQIEASGRWEILGPWAIHMIDFRWSTEVRSGAKTTQFPSDRWEIQPKWNPLHIREGHQLIVSSVPARSMLVHSLTRLHAVIRSEHRYWIFIFVGRVRRFPNDILTKRLSAFFSILFLFLFHFLFLFSFSLTRFSHLSKADLRFMSFFKNSVLFLSMNRKCVFSLLWIVVEQTYRLGNAQIVRGVQSIFFYARWPKNWKMSNWSTLTGTLTLGKLLSFSAIRVFVILRFLAFLSSSLTRFVQFTGGGDPQLSLGCVIVPLPLPFTRCQWQQTRRFPSALRRVFMKTRANLTELNWIAKKSQYLHKTPNDCRMLREENKRLFVKYRQQPPPHRFFFETLFSQLLFFYFWKNISLFSQWIACRMRKSCFPFGMLEMSWIPPFPLHFPPVFHFRFRSPSVLLPSPFHFENKEKLQLNEHTQRPVNFTGKNIAFGINNDRNSCEQRAVSACGVFSSLFFLPIFSSFIFPISVVFLSIFAFDLIVCRHLCWFCHVSSDIDENNIREMFNAKQRRIARYRCRSNECTSKQRNLQPSQSSKTENMTG